MNYRKARDRLRIRTLLSDEELKEHEVTHEIGELLEAQGVAQGWPSITTPNEIPWYISPWGEMF
jgi:hypothetical protein